MSRENFKHEVAPVKNVEAKTRGHAEALQMVGSTKISACCLKYSTELNEYPALKGSCNCNCTVRAVAYRRETSESVACPNH